MCSNMLENMFFILSMQIDFVITWDWRNLNETKIKPSQISVIGKKTIWKQGFLSYKHSDSGEVGFIKMFGYLDYTSI